MYLVSLLSPVAIFLSYFFNACIAHNLYITFYGYKNTYGKRIYVYKIGALVGSVFVLLLSLIFNFGSYDKTDLLSVKFYPLFYLGLIYLAGAAVGVYMVWKILFILKKKNDFFNFLNKDNPENEQRLNVLDTFIKRHLTFIVSFLICYMPNNILILIQLFSWYKICLDCSPFAISVYLMSLSCTVSFVLKMSEPYMVKYVKLVFNYLFRRDVLKVDQSVQDYSSFYNNNNNSMLENNESDVNININNTQPIELNNLGKFKDLQKEAHTLDEINREIESTDFLTRIIALNLAIDEDKKLCFDPKNDELFKTFLPWTDDYYSAKSEFVNYSYTEKELPEWLELKELSKFKINLDIKSLKVRIRKYATLVFHHFKTMDGVNYQECLESLNPAKNYKIIKESFAGGGRSANPILFTHDKKFLLKTISKDEKDIFIKMLPEFHRKMRDANTYLCRIYGIFRIKVAAKKDSHIILMRNMNELSSDVFIL
jgi:hypothetical protein